MILNWLQVIASLNCIQVCVRGPALRCQGNRWFNGPGSGSSSAQPEHDALQISLEITVYDMKSNEL